MPFAVTFDHQGDLLVAEAGPNALGELPFARQPHALALLDEAKTEQAATCWVAGAAGFFYVSNAGSASVTGFQTSLNGQLTRLEPNTATHAGTVDAASVGQLSLRAGRQGRHGR